MRNQYLDIARRLRLQRGSGEPASRRTELGTEADPAPGCWVIYSDPLYGRRLGEVVSVKNDRVVLVPPTADRLLAIPGAWIVSVCESRP